MHVDPEPPMVDTGFITPQLNGHGPETSVETNGTGLNGYGPSRSSTYV